MSPPRGILHWSGPPVDNDPAPVTFHVGRPDRNRLVVIGRGHPARR